MMPRHASDSAEQRASETCLIEALAHDLDIQIAPGTPEGLGGPMVKLDGYSREHRVLAEAYAHYGELKPAQRQKIAADVLKMVYVERVLGGTWRKYLCLADGNAQDLVLRSGWLAEAARTFGIEARVYPLPLDVRKAVTRRAETPGHGQPVAPSGAVRQDGNRFPERRGADSAREEGSGREGVVLART
jgi:hypothetical protein